VGGGGWKGGVGGGTVSGVTIYSDDDATQALYGGLPELRSLLQGPMPSPGASADRFVAALRNGFGANAHNTATLEPNLRGPSGSL
jgi:hypothetical protein